MPSIGAYSRFEKLAFFQSVARHGATASSFEDISDVLKQSQHVRDNTNFDATRFSVEALRRLYDEKIHDQAGNTNTQVNGGLENGERSPKRRKLSTEAQIRNGTLRDDQRLVEDLVALLYQQYKDDVVQEIRQEEEAYQKLQDEIRSLETQIEKHTKQQPQIQDQPHLSNTSSAASLDSKIDTESQRPAPHADPPSNSTRLTPGVQDDNLTTRSQAVPINATPASAPVQQIQGIGSPSSGESAALRQSSVNQPARVSQTPAPIPSQHQSPVGFPRQLPSPSGQRSGYSSIQTPPLYASNQAPPGHVMPQMASLQQRPHSRNPQGNNQNRGSPIPYQSQHPYPPYPPPYPPPQWHPHMPPQQYQHHSPYGPPPQYYPQPPNSRHPQTPQQIPYAPYPHTGPMPYMQQQQQQQPHLSWRGQQWPLHPTPALTTPISRSNSRVSIPGSGSSTPWKRKQMPNQPRTKSPARPEREVSPLTDREDSPVPQKASRDMKSNEQTTKADDTQIQQQSRRRGRPPSVTPSAIGPSRSHSIASRASELQIERQHPSRRGQPIKTEPPSTPLPLPPSEHEQRSSGRRGRPRSSTVTSQADASRTTTSKRKRDSISSASPTRTSQLPNSASALPHFPSQSHDSSLVLVSKNFARTSQLLLSEITSHKLASIFAKPLSERDAPGYKDLVLRPQDLKSIKAAISKGSRAALAVIESIESDSEATPTKVQSALTLSPGVGALRNGFYLIPKTPDLVPPKGIVNSAQLEMELMRMFANAVMFNPLPSFERGFGRELRLRKHGGDVVAGADSGNSSTESDSETDSLSGAEDGIIADAREMFNDIVEVVGKWRELEGERMGAGPEIVASRNGSLAMPVTIMTDGGRHASLSATSNRGEDETVAGGSEAPNTPVPGITTGPGRKRRKLAEH